MKMCPRCEGIGRFGGTECVMCEGRGFSMEALSVLDIFSGSGQLGRAFHDALLESLGVPSRTVAYCERADYPRGVLLSRMRRGEIDAAPIHNDIARLGTGFEGGVDCIVGGWPCQGNSLAGSRKGMADERSGLVVEVIRLVRELGPGLVFLENVPGVLTAPGDGVGFVADALAGLGYELRWTDLSAADVGQAHERRRFWLMAYSPSHGTTRDTRGFQQADGGPELGLPWEPERGGPELGQPENIGHQRPGSPRGRRLGPSDPGQPLVDHHRVGRGEERRGASGPSGHGRQPSEAVGDCPGERLQVGLDAEALVRRAERSGLPMVPPGRSDDAGWSEVIGLRLNAEPTLRRVAPRLAFRADRIRVVGNGVDYRAAKAAAQALLGR